jgi:hypothetical protein
MLEAGLCASHSVHLAIPIVEGRTKCAACLARLCEMVRRRRDAKKPKNESPF